MLQRKGVRTAKGADPFLHKKLWRGTHDDYPDASIAKIRSPPGYAPPHRIKHGTHGPPERAVHAYSKGR